MKPLTQERTPMGMATQTRRGRIDVVLISSDDTLLIELGPILGDRYRTHSIDSPLAIASTLEGSRWFALIDLASLPDAHAAVARMGQRYRHVPVIVIDPQPEGWRAAIARGAIVAAVTREQLGGARLNEALAAAELALNRESRADSASVRIQPGARGRGAALSSLARLWSIAALLLLLSTGAWWLLHKAAAKRSPARAATAAADSTGANGTQPGAPAPATTMPQTGTPGAATPEAPPKSQTVLELLSAARVVFHDPKLMLPRADSQPRGDSALELYTQVLSQDPGNDEALDGIKRLLVVAKARIQSDLSTGRLDDATRLVGFFRDAGLDEEALRDMQASLQAARPKWLLAHAQQSVASGDLVSANQVMAQLKAAGADPAALGELSRAIDAKKLEQQLAAQAGQVHEAISAGALLEPENDNALTRLAAMRALSRADSLTLAAQRELRSALLARAQQAIGGDQFESATRYIAAASELGGAAEISDAKRQLQAEMALASQRAEQRAAAARAATAAAQPPPAVGPVKAAPSVAAGDPQGRGYIAARPLRPLYDTYPPGAGRIEGRVIVEFTLHPDGGASDARIVEAQPKGLFERAALDAVREGRYDTHALVDGQPLRARIILRFKPD